MKTFLDFLSEATRHQPNLESFTPEELREKYICGSIFKNGSLIEQISTGKIGTVMRRGTNYLICLTDDGNLFKPWITDSKELK
jgi:hypothetical protein